MKRRKFCFFLGEILAQLGKTILRGVVFLLFERQLFNAHAINQPTEFVDFHRRGLNLHFQTAGGLIDKIDGLIRQLTRGDVTVGECGRCHQRAISNDHFVVSFVTLFEAAQNSHGVFNAWLADKNLLETALQCRVLLNELPIFVESRGTNEA